jgi:3-deoxy-7-phosphoheptulonate synthase
MDMWSPERKNAIRLPAPAQIAAAHPDLARAHAVVARGRRAIEAVLDARDTRLVVVVGPCSIHDPRAALEYATHLVRARARFSKDLEIVMRVYFEKPRTTVGWKGLINDPHLDGSGRIETGLTLARALLYEINLMGVPTATEFLDPFTPAYLSDLVAWAAIGARTTESQTHREVASGLPMPVGFKNGTDGNVRIAVDAIIAAARAHHFMSIDAHGAISTVSSRGNPYGHVVLRGGKQPNFDRENVRDAHALLSDAKVTPRLFIDASHGNSQRQYRNQIPVCDNIAMQTASGSPHIAGVMIESNLVEGRQDPGNGQALEYGKSITDACLSWRDTESVLERLAGAVDARRLAHAIWNDGPQRARELAGKISV